MILCLTGGIHSVTSPASAAGMRAFNCWSALVLSNQARVEQSRERVLPIKNGKLGFAKRRENLSLASREGKYITLFQTEDQKIKYYQFQWVTRGGHFDQHPDSEAQQSCNLPTFQLVALQCSVGLSRRPTWSG